MSVGSRREKTITVFFFAIGLTYSISIKKDNKKEMMCYVCTPTSNNTDYLEIYNTFSKDEIVNIPICGTNAASNFTLKCPDGYKGCLTTIIHGKNILKSCTEYSITDCKIANNVKYCFCKDSLCNDATILTPIQSSIDDEDSDQNTEDGSGQYDEWIQLNEYKYTRQNITVVLNNVTFKNNSLTTSAGKSWLFKNITILILVFIIYNGAST